MAATAEVVIVGGGVVGCATAYYLARRGVRATVIEKETIGSCASGFAAGLLDPLTGQGTPGALESLSQVSFRMHLDLAQEIAAETGVDFHFRPLSCVWIALDEAELPEYRALFDLARRLEGFPARWLEGTEVLSLEPRLSPRVVGAVCVGGMRQVASYEYTRALAQAAEKYGASVRHGTVSGLKRSGSRVSGIVLEGEEIACERVVLAMGPWTAQAGDWLGTPVPVEPLKGQILRLKLPGPPLGHAFYTSDGGYITSKPDGLTWVGTTEERVGFDQTPTAGARASIMKHALEIMPGLSDGELQLQTACLRPASQDGIPIIGEVPGWDGLYVATGAGRKGILLAPAMARATADLAITGHTDLPIEPCSLARFAGS